MAPKRQSAAEKAQHPRTAIRRARALGIGYAGVPQHQLRYPGEEFEYQQYLTNAKGEPVQPPAWLEFLDAEPGDAVAPSDAED